MPDANPLGEEEEENYTAEMMDRVSDDILVIQTANPSVDGRLLRDFHWQEEDSCAEFARKHGWLVTATFPLCNSRKSFLKS